MKYMLLIYGNEELWASFEPEVLRRGPEGDRRAPRRAAAERRVRRRLRAWPTRTRPSRSTWWTGRRS